MQCPKCNYNLPQSLEITFTQPIFIALTVKFLGNGEMVKTADPYLNTEKVIPELDLKNRNNFELYCPNCNSKILVSSLVQANFCICNKGTSKDEYCSAYERHFCSSCYKLIMPKICSACLRRGTCSLYVKKEE